MKTRVDKYFDETDNTPKRTKKNNDLYEEIKYSDLNDFNVASNAKVIGENNNQMDIDKIKELLEKNYQDMPKRRSIKLDLPEEEELELEKTKEYDINAILEKARAEKEVDYEEERLKKVRDTQYDILKNLELDAKEVKTTTEKNKEELLDLINTITLNEKQNKETKEELDPLDILSDLRGDDNTVVVGAKEMPDEPVKTEEEIKKEINSALGEDVDDSFYTNSMSFNKKDFDSFEDESGVGSIIIKILIVLIFIAIVVGIVIFLNDFLNLELF